MPGRSFNTTGLCNPKKHYMVSMQDKVRVMRELVDDRKYFALSCPRQYGKTTLLNAFRESAEEDYGVFFISLQDFSLAESATESGFAASLAGCILNEAEMRPEALEKILDGNVLQKLRELEESGNQGNSCSLRKVFQLLRRLCHTAQKPLVLIIDEADALGSNIYFLNFLGMIRSAYLNTAEDFTFQSVILAGVCDIRNLSFEIHSEEEYQANIPFNILVDPRMDMCFSVDGIAGMLQEYDADHHTGMDAKATAQELRAWTSGWPVMVSELCRLMDKQVPDEPGFTGSAWTREGVSMAVRILLKDAAQNVDRTLFSSLNVKIQNSPKLAGILEDVLFCGEDVPFIQNDPVYMNAMILGFIQSTDGGNICLSSRIVESWLYQHFCQNRRVQYPKIYEASSSDRNILTQGGRLNMDLLLRMYAQMYGTLYGEHGEIDEGEGLRRFLQYLTPVINGTGNYYIEAGTRDKKRMDVVVDCLGEQFVVELKIWRGLAYHRAGEKQLAGCLDRLHLRRGYMLTYNFNQKKDAGVQDPVHVNGKVLIEVVV